MTEAVKEQEPLGVPGAPAIPGLSFRGFRGEADYPLMAGVIAGSLEADQREWAVSVEEVARNYSHLENSDPWRDMLFVEMDGCVVGYSRVDWYQQDDGVRLYQGFAYLLPEWRDTGPGSPVPGAGQEGRAAGLRHAMVRWCEQRLREIDCGLPETRPVTGRFYQTGAGHTESDWLRVLEQLGYAPVRWGYEMVRSLAEPVPDLPLREGVEVRPVGREHLPAIWEAAREAFRDHWGYSSDVWSDLAFQAYQDDPLTQPELFQVAWAGDEVVGAVQSFLNERENEKYGRKRGYTEGIFVRRPWRRQGVARALISRSMRMFLDMGMTETAHGVDANNPNGALQLYTSLGYRVDREFITYRKEM
ncbi:MAG TPA: GNAT family N-acetyltransferase [Anaerolineae bacterium]|nr:GNAT family N-acetyltransferase [Anaerolineae bacterium]